MRQTNTATHVNAHVDDITAEIAEMERTWHSVRQVALERTDDERFTGFIVYEWERD